MRNIKLTTFLLASVTFIQSCSLLDIEAENTISGDVYTDQTSIQNALNGAYYNYAGISDGSDGGELMGGDFILIPTLLARKSGNTFQEISWQSVDAPLSYLEFINKAVLPTNDRIAANWRRAYETINIVNNIIANIEKVEDVQEKNRIHGEALAIRGSLYLHMAWLWGKDVNDGGSNSLAVPIRTEPIVDINDIPEMSTSSRATVAQVYGQAQSDLDAASTLLQPFGKNGTALSYYAVEAFLAKLHLQMGNYTQAVTHADNVIDGPFSLANTPMAAFGNSSNSSEDIFAIQQTLANNAGDVSTGIGVTTFYSSLSSSGLGTMGILQSSFKNDDFHNAPLFADNDLRGSIDATLTRTSSAASVGPMFYNNIANNLSGLLSTAKYRSGNHVLPVIRLAEMYLLRAEATFEADNRASIDVQAIRDLNEVRTRAGISAIPESFSDVSAFMDSVMVERSRELCYEGHLLRDLKRWGGYIGLPIIGEWDPWDDEFILPIPQSETDTWSD